MSALHQQNFIAFPDDDANADEGPLRIIAFHDMDPKVFRDGDVSYMNSPGEIEMFRLIMASVLVVLCGASVARADIVYYQTPGYAPPVYSQPTIVYAQPQPQVIYTQPAYVAPAPVVTYAPAYTTQYYPQYYASSGYAPYNSGLGISLNFGGGGYGHYHGFYR